MAAVDVSGLGVVDLLDGYRAKSFSPAEVLADVGARVVEREPSLGALVAERLEAATAEADRATASYLRPSRSGRRRLEGIPFVAKDLIATAQLPTRLGLESWPGEPPRKDATAVARLRGAGAILIAKSATHQLGLGVTCASRDLPARTRNPWNPSLSPGGSSGGSAVAVASGESPLALGTDTAGSIRIPADFCGVFGLRPSSASVPLDGVWPIAPSVDQVGPIARSAGDLAITFECLAGSGPPAKGTERANPPVRFEALRVGISRDLDGGLADAERLRWTERAAAHLEARGASVEELSLPRTRDAQEILALTISEALRLFPPPHAPLQSEVRERFESAEAVRQDDLVRARSRRGGLVAELRESLGRVDVLLSPVAGRGAIPVSEGGGSPEFRAAVMACSAPQSLSGLPAVAVPIGLGADGLPIGVQLAGRAGSEKCLLALAAALGRLGSPPATPPSSVAEDCKQSKGNEQ